VESGDSSGVSLLPVDRNAIRLPEADHTEVELRYLPRNAGVTGRPLIGDAWNDPRVVGGTKLAAALSDVWQRLRLVEIIAALPSIHGDSSQAYSFNIITSGGTRVVWGAAPGHESTSGESPFDQKRKRLMDYAAQYGQLESINGPEEIDVRSDLIIKPRTARNRNKTNVK
jgi:hypothetical protein